MAQGQIIIRRKKTNETRIQNNIIWDENISTMARFSLIAMLSMREGWDYSVRGVASMLHVSKDTMSKYIRELEEAGYLKRMQIQGENGQFGKATYLHNTLHTPGRKQEAAGRAGKLPQRPSRRSNLRPVPAERVGKSSERA